MIGRKFKREASGPGRGTAELSLREGKQKSILLREAEFEQPAGRARSFSYYIRNYFQLGFQIGRLPLNPALLSQQFKANPPSCSEL